MTERELWLMAVMLEAARRISLDRETVAAATVFPARELWADVEAGRVQSDAPLILCSRMWADGYQAGIEQTIETMLRAFEEAAGPEADGAMFGPGHEKMH